MNSDTGNTDDDNGDVFNDKDDVNDDKARDDEETLVPRTVKTTPTSDDAEDDGGHQ